MVNHAWKTAVENGIIFHADIAPLPELSIKTRICVYCWEMPLIMRWRRQGL